MNAVMRGHLHMGHSTPLPTPALLSLLTTQVRQRTGLHFHPSCPGGTLPAALVLEQAPVAQLPAGQAMTST